MPSISAFQFIELLNATEKEAAEDAADLTWVEQGTWRNRYRIPTGPWDSVDLHDPEDLVLEVADTLDLRGRNFKRPVFLYGVRFRGRVDLRDVRIHGSADFTACIFDEELRLDDSEIDGSLRLTRITTDRLTLNGVIVRGRLDLSGSQSRQPISLFDAEVDGFVDLRGIDTKEVRLKGAHIRSDLRMGCAPDGGGFSDLSTVDARGCRVQGNVSIEGAGTGQGKCTAEIRQALDRQKIEAGFCWRHEPQWRPTGLSVDLSSADVGGDILATAYRDKEADKDDLRKLGLLEVKHGSSVIWPVLSRLSLTGARVRGNISILGTLVTDGVDAKGVHIGGNLRLEPGELVVNPKPNLFDWVCRQTEVRGGIEMGGARIDGQVLMTGLRLRGRLDLSSAEIGSHIEIRGHLIQEPFLSAQGEESPKSPVGHVVPTAIDGDVQLYLCQLRSSIRLMGVRVGGDLGLWSIQSKAFVHLLPFLNLSTLVGGGIDLHSAQMLQFLVEGAVVRGRVRLDGCDMLHFVVRPGRLKLPDQSKPDPLDPEGQTHTWSTQDSIVLSELGHLRMRNGRISGDMKLEYLQVTGREFEGTRGLVIEDSEIAGSLNLFGELAILVLYMSSGQSSADARKNCPIDYRNFGASVLGKISVKRTKIGGAVELSAVKVEGGIDFEDSTIGGDLRMAAIDCNDSPPKLAQSGPNSTGNSTVCHSLNLRMAKCMNDVDLTGLVVVCADGGRMRDAKVEAQYLTVSGDLICFNKERRGRGGFARIDGELNLSYAQLSHLVVSGCMLNPCLPWATDGSERRGLVLERARVGKLEILESSEDSAFGQTFPCQGSAAYPIPICLTDVSVEVWEVQGSEERGNHGGHKYVNLLENDKPFRRSTYRSLENSLRNGGDDEHADILYQAMKDREWRELVEAGQPVRTAPLLNRIVSRFRLYVLNAPRAAGHHAFRVFLRYGTSPMSLFAIVLLLFIVSFPAYQNPTNFQTSLAYLAVPKDRFPESVRPRAYDASPTGDEWKLADSVQVALKNHLPIVPFQARDEWQPKDKGSTAWSLEGGDCTSGSKWKPLTVCLPLAPEDTFNFIQLLNWICWPILLTFMIRRLLKQV